MKANYGHRVRKLARMARIKASGLQGNSTSSHSKREWYLEMANTLEAALVLCNGPIESRNIHWRNKLPALVARASSDLGEN